MKIKKIDRVKRKLSYDEIRESLRPHNIDLNDQKVMRHVFWEGRFPGIFQFSNRGIRKLAQSIRPDCFEDVSAITSLYRPGPLGSGMHRLYADNKRLALDGKLKFEHPVLEDVLRETHACVVYQEQLMKVCQLLGKMELKDVQRVRKTLLKKDKSKSEEFLKKEGDELRAMFVAGCVENGLTEKRAEEWWKDLLAWGGYGFNSAHSKAYSVITMQCAHLATYHPMEFYAAVLTKGETNELQSYVSDMKKCGVRILPVDVNKSKLSNIVETDEKGEAIRLSLLAVKGVGEAGARKIIEAQPFTDVLDFVDRNNASRTTIKPLILVGAFNSIDQHMKGFETKYDMYCSDSKLKSKKNREKLVELMNTPSDEVAATQEFNAMDEVKRAQSGELGKDYSEQEKVFFENQLLTFSLRGSPFEILDRDKKIEAIFGDSVKTYTEFVEGDDEVCMMPVVVNEIKERPQRSGDLFAWIKFAVETGEEFEAPCFSNIWKFVSSSVRRGNVYVVTFNRKIEDDPHSLIVGKKGWKHGMNEAVGYFIDIDAISM